MIRPLALLTALLTCAGIVAGCAKEGEQPRIPTVSVAHFDIATDPLSLNPLFAHADAAVVEQQLAHLCFEPFFDLDARGRPVPELITAMPSVTNGGISNDGRTLTYHLRAGIRWSDGVPVSARDVLYTLHAILDPHNPVASHEGYELIERADAPSPSTVRFHLRKAWAP
ncbi:MAG TPA: ABC transporter substrate-binding protein, partial [Candidatus Baltobacteraceae bacterium]